MRITVMGAGAVGCYFGGLLAEADHEVTFVGRTHHVDAINRNGLQFETKDGTRVIRTRAATRVHSTDKPDLVLFCVKSNDTESAGRELLGNMRGDCVVLSLQNGVDNSERLAAIIGSQVIPGTVYVGAEMAGPGHIRHHGRGELLIGPSPRSDQLARAFNRAGIPTAVTPDIWQALWNKLIANCAYNALSAVTRLPYGALLEVEGMRELIACIVRECVAVASACDVPVADNILEQVFGIAGGMPGQYSSTAQDLLRGKRTEVDFLNGYIVRKGAECAVATPINQALQAMMKALEGRGPVSGQAASSAAHPI